MLNNAKPSLTNLPLLLLLLVGAQGGRRRGRGGVPSPKTVTEKSTFEFNRWLEFIKGLFRYTSRLGHSIVKLLNQKGEFFLPNLFGHGLTNAVKRRLEKTTCTAMHCDEELEIHSN